ncbi:MAG: hypothetical protein SW833_07195 [Cyanobacteriota bacterium]|nr:hypothetical protein [Cyanobacteriota bacterium]
MNIEQFQQGLAYRKTVPIRQLKQDLEKIAEFARFHEAENNKGKKLTRRGFLFIVISVVGSSVIFVLANALMEISVLVGTLLALPILLLVLMMPVGIVIAILGYVQQKRHHSFSLLGRRHRYQLLQSLMEVWQKDFNFSQKLKLSLDLRRQDEKEKFHKQEPYANRKKGKIDFYRDEWLKVKGQFLDETKFFLQVTERHQVRSWKNENGKKRVRSIIKGFEILLTLKYIPERYPGVLNLKERANSAVQLPATVKLKRLKIADDKLTMKAKVTLFNSRGKLKDLLFQSIILMFMSLYQILNLARAINQREEKLLGEL